MDSHTMLTRKAPCAVAPHGSQREDTHQGSPGKSGLFETQTNLASFSSTLVAYPSLPDLISGHSVHACFKLSCMLRVNISFSGLYSSRVQSGYVVWTKKLYT